MPPQTQQYSNWVFTLNYGSVRSDASEQSSDVVTPSIQPTAEEANSFWLALCAGSITYAIVGDEEAPTTGQRHLQGYVQFDRKRRLSELKKLDGAATVHWEPAKGSLESNQTYCKKANNWREYGLPRDTTGGERERKRWRDALADIKSNSIDNIDPQIQICQARNVEYLRQKYMPLAANLDPGHKHLWIYGPTGSGKSREAREIFGDEPFYDKLQNKWWDYYDGEDNVIIDDLEKSNAVALTAHLKRWLDIYRFTCEAKNSVSRGIRPKRIIITSNYHPDEIWTEASQLDPILRRLEVRLKGATVLSPLLVLPDSLSDIHD